MLTKNNARRSIILPFMLLMILVLVVACGAEVSESDEIDGSELSESTMSESESGDETDVETGQSNDVSDMTESSDPEESSSAQEDESANFVVEPNTSDVSYEGTEVGFTEDGHPYRGNPEAPVVIMEFSDFQCPFCARFYEQTLPSLVENQISTGEAVLIFYDFPLNNIHPQASAASNAARCAGEQGADSYWAMHDLLFENGELWSVPDADEVFIGYAEDLELDIETFELCISDVTFSSEIEADLQAGRALGISGTPSFVINGQLLVGAQPLPVFENAIATIKEGGQLASNEPEPAPEQPQAAPTPASILSDYAATLGDPDAPVKIVEFTDYQCPYCSQHSLETLPRIISELVDTGRVFYAQKDLPLDQLHPNARIAAAAARCASDQGAYWEMHDTLFARQSDWAGADSSINDIFSSYAAEHGLDEVAFIDCLDSGQHDAAVEANAREASSLGISGTPFFFVDGYPLNGARPYEHFELAVQYAEEGRLAEAYSPPPEEPQQPTGPQDVPIGDAYTIGDPDAPITIVEFTDFQCPFCSRHVAQTFPRIVEDFVDTGVARYVFKDFPLTSIHPQAVAAAEAARCAGDQDQFLEMHGTLFEQQSLWSGSQPTDIFVEFAQDLGLDTDTFADCLSNGKYEAAVNADLQQGIQLGVTGTPAFFINGYPISGAQPFELFQQAIESILAENEG